MLDVGTFFKTRGKYIPVRSTAASLLLTVLKNVPTPSNCPAMRQVLFGETVCRMDAAHEPTGMYSRRVSENNTCLIGNEYV